MEYLEKSIQLKYELDAHRPIEKEQEKRIWQKFRLDWNFHSNNLEGNILNYGETKALLLHNITAQGKPLKDHLEIKGHEEAIQWMLDFIKQERDLTEKFIRELHELILKESYEVKAITPDGKPTKKKINIGQYKTTPNHVKTVTGEIFHFASPEETPLKMHELVNWYNIEKLKTDVNPIILASEFHYKFIRIHPFDDGNGRIARILMNFILISFTYPPVIIKTDDKKNYFNVLQQADGGKFEPFVEYIAKNLCSSLEIMIKGAKGGKIEDDDDIDKEISLLKEKLKNKGEEIKVTKNKESLLKLFEKSIIPLANSLFDGLQQFDDLYIENKRVISSNGQGFHSEDKYNQIRNIINEKIIYNMNIEYYNYYFKNTEFNEFSYNSKVKLVFHQTSYEVIDNDEIIFKKLYSEQLSKDEISYIVNQEKKKHKDFILKQTNINN